MTLLKERNEEKRTLLQSNKELKEINTKLSANMVMIRKEDDRIIQLRDDEIKQVKKQLDKFQHTHKELMEFSKRLSSSNDHMIKEIKQLKKKVHISKKPVSK